MHSSVSVIIVDPLQKNREALLQAIHFQKIVNHVSSFKTLDDALTAIRGGKTADIVLVSANFPKYELSGFISAAKQSTHGRDGAFLMIFDESVNRVVLAKGLLHGTDGFVIAPFSVDDVQSAVISAEKIRHQNLVRRIETAAQQMIEVLRDEVSFVACDKALGKSTSYKSSARDAAELIRSFSDEEKEIYFGLLLTTFGKIPAPVAFLGHARTAERTSDLAIDELIAELKSRRARCRAIAVRRLGLLGREAMEAVPYLEEILLSDPDPLCRHRAKVALEIILPPEEAKETIAGIEDPLSGVGEPPGTLK